MHRWLATCLLALGLVCFGSPALAKHKLRIATLAPKSSSWGKVFRAWEKAIAQKSNNELELEVYYNAVQGNEDNMVGKMKTGQLDGAALTSVGLSQIHKDVLVQQLPGVVDSWDLLDKVRKAIGPDLDKKLEQAGFQVVGWGDIGLVRQMTRGFEL
jgi:TRAP-type C4-dicarboxylate transport system substrate-binding protein